MNATRLIGLIFFQLALYSCFFGQEITGAKSLTVSAANLFKQAQTDGRKFAEAARMNPEVIPTSDGKSYFVAWSSTSKPTKWIVSLHGAGFPAKGYATDDLAIWRRHLEGRNVGIICLQWWLGKGSSADDFYTPTEIYAEIDNLLKTKKITPGSVMLTGFSRGSANTYAVAAIDAGRGKKYFSLIVASSGGMSPDYPPNKSIAAGEFGKNALKGTNWITAAGALDPNSDRDGVEGMRKTATWLRDQGAVVLKTIEDPKFGHGALSLNPENSKVVLDIFLK